MRTLKISSNNFLDAIKNLPIGLILCLFLVLVFSSLSAMSTSAADPSASFNNTTSVSIDIQRFTIFVSAGTGGTISPSGNFSVRYGANQTLVIAPIAGYRIANVMIDGTAISPVTIYTFTNISANHTISASFDLTPPPTPNNTPPASPNNPPPASPNITTSAYFDIQRFTIFVSAGTGGTISPSGNFSVRYGANQTLVIAPIAGYRIANVMIDGTAISPVTIYTFTNISANHTISASFDLTPPPTPNNTPPASPNNPPPPSFNATTSASLIFNAAP